MTMTTKNGSALTMSNMQKVPDERAGMAAMRANAGHCRLTMPRS
jgi:hypothetical protein